ARQPWAEGRNPFGIGKRHSRRHFSFMPTRLTPTPKGNYFLQRNPDPKAAAMKQSLSTILVLALVALISRPGAAQQAQPSPTPGGRGGGTPPPIQAKPEELA